ncbi:MAG: twin-arginine translocase subunit TatC [Opitutia bacterium Tous-C1TDCM]|nr:MAG: twin-arginine translocase subunit TatC [Opitutae bacterium Tous-C1TDCM]
MGSPRRCRRPASGYIALPFSEKLPTIRRSTRPVSQTNPSPEDPQLTDDLPPAPEREKPMGFWDHLEELRGVIVKSVIAFIVAAVLIGAFIKEFNDVLLWPLQTVQKDYPGLVIELGTQKVMEVFSMIIQMCVLGGLVIAAPAILFFIGQFVAPALTEKEMRAVLPMCVSALILFLLGAAFGFFLLMPKTIQVAVELNQTFNLALRWTAGDYYSTLSWLVLGVGAAFEFPLIIVLLVWLGIMSTAFLRKYRRHAVVAIFVMAAIITPTPDPVTQTIFAIPLYALFEISILASSRIEKKRQGAARFGN